MRLSPGRRTVIEQDPVLVEHADGDQRLVPKTKRDRLHHGAASGTLPDPIDLGELRNDAEVLVDMVDKAFDVHGHFTGEQQLLSVELARHFFLKRLVEKLSENDDERKHDENGQDEHGGSKYLLLFEDADKTLQHAILYFTKRRNVKQLKERTEDPFRAECPANLRFNKAGITVLLIQDIIDLGKYFHWAERFYDIFVSSDLLAPFLLVPLTFGGQHDDVGFFKVRVVLDGTADVIAVDLRHHNVEEEDIGRDLPDLSECLAAVFCYRQRISFILEEVGERFPDILIIVRYKYFRVFHL